MYSPKEITRKTQDCVGREHHKLVFFHSRRHVGKGGRIGIAPLILIPGARLRYVSILPSRRFASGKEPRDSLKRRLDGPQNRLGRIREEKSVLLPACSLFHCQSNNALITQEKCREYIQRNSGVKE
jgi:hypothetical protein